MRTYLAHARTQLGGVELGALALLLFRRGAQLLGNFPQRIGRGAQVTLDRRFDVLGTVQLRDAFEPARYGLIGAALLRKTAALDLSAELAYDTERRALYPGLALSGRVLPTLGLTAALTTHAAPELTGEEPRALAVRVTAQWFYASDR